MSFLSPAAFFLSLLLPVIIVMYLLKLRRQNQKVSSIFLWQQLVRDVEANAPWQKLRNNLIMILQLLFLVALIFALAEPFMYSKGSGGETMILIIDSSASMGATDSEPSRLEAAKKQARSFVEEAPEQTRITLIEAGSQTAVLVSASQDRRQVQQALSSIQVGAGESDMASALQLTAAITLRQPNTDIYIFSDGRFNLPDHLKLKGNLYYYPIGTESNNQGISNVQLQQNISGENNSLFVQVTNYGGEDVERSLEIYADDKLFDAVELQLNAYAQEIYLRDSVPTDVQTVSVKLTGEDFLPLDDQAWVVPQNLNPIEVLLVSSGNRFLEAAFGLLPNINLTVLSPEAYEQSGEYAPPMLTVFDSYVPPDDLFPTSALLFIAPTVNTSFFSITGMVDQPSPRRTDPDDPILEWIEVNEISIFDAVKMPLPDWSYLSISGVTETGEYPLLFYGSTQGQRVAVLAFQLQHSDLPLQIAFPLLVVNLTNWLAPNQFETNPNKSELATLSFSAPLTVRAVTVLTPNGEAIRYTPDENGLVLVNGAQPGVYQIHWGEDFSALAAVNFFSSAESDIKPAGNLDLGGISDSSEELVLDQSKRVFWRPIAFAGLVILVAEWLVYHRGTLAKIWLVLTRKEHA
jgi:Ca-activated chloride channel family protein